MCGVEASGAQEPFRVTGLDDQETPGSCPHRLFDVVKERPAHTRSVTMG